MPRVKALCLAMGVVSLALLAAALLMAWFVATLPAQRAGRASPADFTARVQAATSCEALRTVCTGIASGYDEQRSTVSRLNRLTDELLKRIAWFGAGWALATALAFFYILRTVARHSWNRPS